LLIALVTVSTQGDESGAGESGRGPAIRIRQGAKKAKEPTRQVNQQQSTSNQTMLTSYLKLALRNLVKHKVYTLLNVGGLAIGMACSILILIFSPRYQPSAKSGVVGTLGLYLRAAA
jgi:hypothetical protein